MSELTDFAVNDYRSFLVAPDGSKEGWPDSDLGDGRRARLVEYLDAQRYSDDSTCLAWAEIQFGDDNLVTAIVRDSDEPRRRRHQEEL
ncbi:hypothetical protein JRC04_04635 [Mycolicibacterium sp. S2-37]|uniref:hypothetical protein n=1 Tax=Mycolicibacterium sp. S2-37 TaxID=2810297 RepID=UPI001A9488C6|nr:hypothetical protein [Mycolicibacterium sp. S2-37]MBO0676745.1 hypothetical protein [Mycolicibacterium sp. S2-37]